MSDEVGDFDEEVEQQQQRYLRPFAVSFKWFDGKEAKLVYRAEGLRSSWATMDVKRLLQLAGVVDAWWNVRLIHAGSEFADKDLLLTYNVQGEIDYYVMFLTSYEEQLGPFYFGRKLSEAYLQMLRGRRGHTVDQVLTCPAVAARIRCVLLCHVRCRRLREPFGSVLRPLLMMMLEYLLCMDVSEIECSVPVVNRSKGPMNWLGWMLRPRPVEWARPDVMEAFRENSLL